MLHQRWPFWWGFQVVFSSHARRRMLQRGLHEVQARQMLEGAHGLRPQADGGTWCVLAMEGKQAWMFVIKPNLTERRIEIITLYPVDG